MAGSCVAPRSWMHRLAAGQGLGAIAAAGLAVLVSASGAARADTWVLDRQATQLTFGYDHFGLSHQSGRFADVQGRLELSPTDPDSGEIDITIRAASIATGVPELDRVLRSPDFFDARGHPEIRFRSTEVRRTGERTADVTGDLSMLGVTEPVTLAVRWNFTGEHPLAPINPVYQGKWVSGFSATAVIERSRWGMKRGIPLLSDTIDIRIEAEFLRTE